MRGTGGLPWHNARHSLIPMRSAQKTAQREVAAPTPGLTTNAKGPRRD